LLAILRGRDFFVPAVHPIEVADLRSGKCDGVNGPDAGKGVAPAIPVTTKL
jgi:hypothetical protein